MNRRVIEPPRGVNILLVLQDGREFEGWFDSISKVYYALGMHWGCENPPIDSLVIGWKLTQEGEVVGP